MMCRGTVLKLATKVCHQMPDIGEKVLSLTN